MGALPKVVKLRGAWAQNDDVPAAIQDPFMGINYRQPFDLTKTRINSCVCSFLGTKRSSFESRGPSKLAASVVSASGACFT
jgi:hypothetical protein